MRDKADDTNPTAPVSPLKRRGLLIGAGAAGAAVLAAKKLSGAAPAVTTAAAAKIVDTSGGYQVNQHVLRYYETTRT